MILFNSAFLLICFIFFCWKRILRFLHIFQQEDYNPARFIKWMLRNRSFDRRLSLIILILSLVFVITETWLGYEFILGALFALFAGFEEDPRRIAKKKLILTHRAQRIVGMGLFLCIGVGCGALFLQSYLTEYFAFSSQSGLLIVAIVPWILAVQFIPFALIGANILLNPVETFIQKRIMKRATEKLRSIPLKTIGITGSFGKTSVKHILGHILELNAPTLYTPGSVNTLMGISRVILESLTSATQFFIVEMGAYGKGSIAKLCHFTPPDVGVITAIGEAHYERFRSLEAVAKAKFELAESVLRKADGKIVIHESVLDQAYAHDFVAQNRARFIICGGHNSDFEIKAVEQTTSGLTIEVKSKDESYSLFVPLFGSHHASNAVLAFVAALSLGIPASKALVALRTVPQIKHRLEVKAESQGMTYIDDAFNSNPRGFLSALELLDHLGRSRGGRRILITPGIVELGSKHDQVHRELGLKAAHKTDAVIVVRSDRIPSFSEGYLEGKTGGILQHVATLKEAQTWLFNHGQKGDIVLIENDLPDLGESHFAL